MPARTDPPVPLAPPGWTPCAPGARPPARSAVALATAPEMAPACPTGGRAMVRTGTRTRTITASHAEPVTRNGRRDRCSACGAEPFPLAEALDLGPSG